MKQDPAAARRAVRQPKRPAGFEARLAAVQLIDAVLVQQDTLDDALDTVLAGLNLAPRDRAFTRLLAATTLRHTGTLEALLAPHVKKRPVAGHTWAVLLASAAQLKLLETPPHAAISLAVEIVGADHRSRHLKGLVNAVLRNVARSEPAVVNSATLDVPNWMRARWASAYGAEMAVAIAAACLEEAALDLSVKADAARWAERLGGIVLPTGTVRLLAKGPVEELDGFGDGAWWVQDAAAALPPRLLGTVAGKRIADLCAAPGGKTAWLAAAGARVVAVDGSSKRLERLGANLKRLSLDADVVCADIASWHPGELFDAVLLDAPCSATGTIRRHPDILRNRTLDGLTRLAETQARLLDAAAALVKPGGDLVYCTCSLEPEEGPDQIAAFLERNCQFTRRPIAPEDVAGCSEFVTPSGELRTLPCHWRRSEVGLSGIDGFFAARLANVAG